MHRRASLAASRSSTPPPAHPFPCSSLVKTAATRVASVSNIRFEKEAPAPEGASVRPGEVPAGVAGRRYVCGIDICVKRFSEKSLGFFGVALGECPRRPAAYRCPEAGAGP